MPWAWGLLVVMGHLPGAVQVAVTSSIELVTLQAGRCLFAGSEMFSKSTVSTICHFGSLS